MPDEYDAFGRRQDDAGLGDLGWGTTPAEPVQHQSPAGPTAPGATFQTVRPAGTGLSAPRRNPLVLVIQVLVIAAIVGAIVLAVTAGKKANDTVRDTLDQFTPNNGTSQTTTTVGDGDGDVPKQVKADSFFTERGLRAGLRILAKEQPGRITNFSMRKDRINVQVNRGGKSHNVQLSAGAEAPEELSSSTATQSGRDRTMTYEELSPAAPPRLMRAANSRLGQSPKSVDYFVAQKFLGPLTWGIYYKNAKIAQGDSRGRFTRRIS